MLLTGGAGQRYGGPKHLQPHPAGGSWASHLVGLFERVLGPGPMRILGDSMPDRPELVPIEDPREGPARALARWAGNEQDTARRWWVVGCDQVVWEEASLRAWHTAACAEDPDGEAWVLAILHGEIQPLGGFLGHRLLPAAAASAERRLLALARTLSRRELAWDAAPFQDMDDPKTFQNWLARRT